MLTIYKYPLLITDEQQIELPGNSQILSVAEVRNKVVLYALVDTEAKFTNCVTILIYSTGQPFQQRSALGFIGTVVTNQGRLVWHVFEE